MGRHDKLISGNRHFDSTNLILPSFSGALYVFGHWLFCFGTTTNNVSPIGVVYAMFDGSLVSRVAVNLGRIRKK